MKSMKPRLLIVCGEPGVGKSKVARHIARRTFAKHLATDSIRKYMFGENPEYTQEESQAVYDEMFGRAEALLNRGKTVVLDATFMLAQGRERAHDLAEEHDADFDIIRVTAPASECKYRIRKREDSDSDADVSVYQSIADRFEPVELPHIEIDNSEWWFHTTRQLVDAGVVNE